MVPCANGASLSGHDHHVHAREMEASNSELVMPIRRDTGKEMAISSLQVVLFGPNMIRLQILKGAR